MCVHVHVHVERTTGPGSGRVFRSFFVSRYDKRTACVSTVTTEVLLKVKPDPSHAQRQRGRVLPADEHCPREMFAFARK